MQLMQIIVENSMSILVDIYVNRVENSAEAFNEALKEVLNF